MRSLLPLVFLAITAVACGGSEDRTAEPDGEAELRRSGVVDVTEADNGKTITVEKGKSVRLKLSSNPTTGYRWKVTSTNRTFGYPSPRDGNFEGGGSGGPIGSGGHQVFTWSTNGPQILAGNNVHHVELEYRRSFESEREPEDAFSFSVKIKAPAGAEEPPAEEARQCPTSNIINCMPPTTNRYCSGEMRDWVQQNCDVSYLD